MMKKTAHVLPSVLFLLMLFPGLVLVPLRWLTR